MENRLEETPNGCRLDNGRCFDRLEWDAATLSVYAYFHDGSEYEYFGLSEEEALLWLSQVDPGCFFNKLIWPGSYIRRKKPD